MECKVSDEVSVLGIQVAYLLISDFNRSFFTKSLKNEIEHYYRDLLTALTHEELKNDPHIVGYQELHTQVGVKSKSLIASPESLIKILQKHNKLRSINYIVDTYNYIAIKNRVSIGAHDIELINGNVVLKIIDGNELFIPLGETDPQIVNTGEYCYVDDSNEIICRLDCRQCDKTKTSENTKSCLFIIQGNKYIQPNFLKNVAEQIVDIFKLGIDTQIQYRITMA